MELKECWDKGHIKKTTPNKELIRSLIEMSGLNELTVKTAVINDKTVSSYFKLAYDSLREILEGICILHGYKVNNHICLGELVETLVEGFDYAEFDRLRYARNSISYYGEKLEYEQGTELIKKALKLKDKMLKVLINELSQMS